MHAERRQRGGGGVHALLVVVRRAQNLPEAFQKARRKSARAYGYGSPPSEARSFPCLSGMTPVDHRRARLPSSYYPPLCRLHNSVVHPGSILCSFVIGVRSFVVVLAPTSCLVPPLGKMKSCLGCLIVPTGWIKQARKRTKLFG